MHIPPQDLHLQSAYAKAETNRAMGELVGQETDKSSRSWLQLPQRSGSDTWPQARSVLKGQRRSLTGKEFARAVLDRYDKLSKAVKQTF